MSSFVERHGLWDVARAAAAAEVEAQAERAGLATIRLSFPDQHGVLRGKTIMRGELAGALRDGCTVVSSLLAKDTSHRTVFPVFSAGGGFGMAEMQGAADILMIPDPATFRVLPWAEDTGWLLCDLHFAGGAAVPFATRALMRRAIDRLHGAGYDFVAGLEVELHIFRIENPRLRPEDAGQPGAPPEVSLLTTGYQYLTEQRYDQLDPVLAILRRDLVALGLPLRSLEVEFGPSQAELTFRTGVDLAPADMMVLLRSAVKQICRRHGYHATFMCRPHIPNVMSSGWHLHQSLRDRATGANAFAAPEGGLSAVGRHWLAGLLAHARAGAVFAAPTINAYRRYRPHSMAPDRALWGRDNRGAMVRVLDGPGNGSATRLENRIGEPAANPYLTMTAQILAGLDGLARRLDPGPSSDTPYDTAAPPLPRTLEQALDALRADAFFRDALGGAFVDYYLHIKDAELARFNLEVTAWEQREYFDLF